MNPLPLPVPLAAAEVSSVDTELPAYLFLHELTSRGYVHAVVRDLPVAHTPDVLPEGHQLVLGVDNTAGHDHVALVEDCVVWLESWRRGGRLRVAAAHPEAARRVTEQLLSRLTPSSGPGQVRVEFADAQTGSRHIDLDVTPWPQISHLYPAAVVASMQRLAAHGTTTHDCCCGTVGPAPARPRRFGRCWTPGGTGPLRWWSVTRGRCSPMAVICDASCSTSRTTTPRGG